MPQNQNKKASHRVTSTDKYWQGVTRVTMSHKGDNESQGLTSTEKYWQWVTRVTMSHTRGKESQGVRDELTRIRWISHRPNWKPEKENLNMVLKITHG